ncbi:hypothetical protein TB2_040126 [Malus domestica]
MNPTPTADMASCGGGFIVISFAVQGQRLRRRKWVEENGENWNWKMGTLRVLGSNEGKVGMEIMVELSAAKKKMTTWVDSNWESGFWWRRG